MSLFAEILKLHRELVKSYQDHTATLAELRASHEKNLELIQERNKVIEVLRKHMESIKDKSIPDNVFLAVHNVLRDVINVYKAE